MNVRFQAMDLKRLSGNDKKCLREEVITGIVEMIPMPDGSTRLMIPYDVDQSTKHGIEIKPFSRLDLQKRTIIPLSKKEVDDMFLANAGDEITLKRFLWGEDIQFKVRKI